MGMLTVPSARFSTSVVGSVTAIKGVPDVVKLSHAALSPAVLISLRPVMVPDPLMRVTSSQSFTPFAANLFVLATKSRFPCPFRSTARIEMACPAEGGVVGAGIAAGLTVTVADAVLLSTK